MPTTCTVANIIEDGRLAGPQRRMLSVAIELQGSEVSTTIFLPFKDSDEFVDLLKQRGVNYRKVRLQRLTTNPVNLIKYLLFSPYEVTKLAVFFRREKYDIIHVSGGAWQFKGILAGFFAGSKVIWHLNDTQMPRLIRLLFLFLKRIPNGFIVAGERVADYYLNREKQSGYPIFTIPAPVDTSLFRPDTTAPPKHLLAKDGLNIVMVCNISPIKGVEYFLKMAYRLNQHRNNLHFYVVGPHLTSQQQYIKGLYSICHELALSNVFFYGNSQDVSSILRESDIYVCTSLAEASPTSVWEAMSTAVPVVSTDVGDVGRYIINGKNGFIVPIKDTRALIHSVLRLIDNSDLRDEFGLKSRKIVLENLDIKRVADLHLQAYRAILNR